MRQSRASILFPASLAAASALAFSFSFSCTHTKADNNAGQEPSGKEAVQLPEGNCGEHALDAQHYFLRLMDEKGEPLSSPDLLVDIEKRYDFHRNDPMVKDLDAAGKSCLKIEPGWATVYMFDEGRRQAKVARFADMKTGAITDIRMESIPEKQMTFEYRECEIIPGLEKATKPMIYDLFDASGQALSPAAFKTLFVSAKGRRELTLSSGSCVWLEQGETGKIVASDGRDAYAFAITPHGAENDRYLRIISRKKDSFFDHGADFKGILGPK